MPPGPWSFAHQHGQHVRAVRQPGAVQGEIIRTINPVAVPDPFPVKKQGAVVANAAQMKNAAFAGSRRQRGPKPGCPRRIAGTAPPF